MANHNHPASSFVCAECGVTYRSTFLSQRSVRDAGAISREEAIQISESPLVCRNCAHVTAQQVEVATQAGPSYGDFGRNVQEQFDFSGTPLDEGRRVAYYLNY